MVTIGTILGGRYRLLSVLGDGGMARVYLAADERLHREVAVKILHEQYLGQDEFVRRFEQEAQLAAALSHPNIIAIYDIGREGDAYYIVMEYVEGTSLKAAIAHDAPLKLDRVIVITRQIGAALDTAHAHGVIHRDIKPENILLTPHDDVKVSDFGIARALTAPGQTTTGVVLGSVSYFSPEQAQGKPATAESDLYSTGIVVYEMLTGRLPFTADNPLATAMQHITQPPVPPRTYVPSLPPGIDAVVMKALSKDPSHRYHSGVALADALAAQRPVPIRSSARPTPPINVARTTRVATRPAGAGQRRAPLLPLLATALLGGGLVYAVMRNNPAHLFGAAGSGPTPTATAGMSGGAGGPTVAPSSTATSTATAPTATSGATGGAAATSTATSTASATASPTATTGAGTPSSTATTGAATPSPTATARPARNSPTATRMPTATKVPTATVSPTRTPKPSATPHPSPTHTAAKPGSLSADVVTASGYGQDSNGVPFPNDPRNNFSLKTAQIYVVITVHHLPAGAVVVAHWRRPDGTTDDYESSAPIFYAYIDSSGPGTYSVSAVVNGKVLATHHFTVVGKHGKHATSGSDSAPPAGTPGSAVYLDALFAPVV